MRHFTSFLTSLVYASPTLMVALAGMVIAMVVWGGWPRPAMLVFFGCLLFLLTDVISPLIWETIVRRYGYSVHSAFAAVTSLAYAVAWTMLIWAGFVGRPAANRRMPPPPPRR